MSTESMQVSVTTTKGLERRLEVTVPGERVTGEVDERLKRLARTAKLKGFRPGKVPYAVIRQQFGSQVHAETVNDLMQSTFAEAVSREKLRPASGPRIEPIATADAALRYAAVFEVLPEVSLKPVEQIQVNRSSAQITEADVDVMLESLRAQRPVFTVVARAAHSGDRVSLDFEGRIDGAVFPGGKGEGLSVIIGAHRILPELEDALVGMAVGESKTVPARFPPDYGAASVAGKQAEFDLKVLKVEEQSLPAIDTEFVRAFGIKEGDVPELRAEVRKSMEHELETAVHARLREQLLDGLDRANPLELPRALIDEQVRDLQAQALRRMGTQDWNRAPPAESLQEPARKRVALGLLIGEIVRVQQLKVDRTRVEQRLDALSAGHNDPAALRRQYLQSREAMDQIESSVLEEQAIDWALSRANTVEQPASFAEVTGLTRKAG
jgi:trigger factor